MGTPTTTSYTNLFMDMFETSHLNDFHKYGYVLSITYFSFGQIVKTR